MVSYYPYFHSKMSVNCQNQRTVESRASPIVPLKADAATSPLRPESSSGVPCSSPTLTATPPPPIAMTMNILPNSHSSSMVKFMPIKSYCCTDKECLKSNNNNHGCNFLPNSAKSAKLETADCLKNFGPSGSPPPCCVYHNCLTCIDQLTRGVLLIENPCRRKNSTVQTKSCVEGVEQVGRLNGLIKTAANCDSNGLHGERKGLIMSEVKSHSPNGKFSVEDANQFDINNHRNFDNFNSHIFQDYSLKNTNEHVNGVSHVKNSAYSEYFAAPKEHGCFRRSVPTMPMPVSVLLFLFNCFLPGIGTLLASFMIIFGCQTEYGKHNRKRAFAVSLVASILQALTAIFVVGWVWSVMWDSTKINDRKLLFGEPL